MSRAVWWRLATLFVVGGLAARALWLAWQYYFAGGPRYRVESAMIALVIIGAFIVALRRGDPRVHEAPGVEPDRLAPVPHWWLAVYVVAAPALYYGAIGLGFLSDDYTLRNMAQSDGLGSGTGWFFRPVPLLLWRGLLAAADTLLHSISSTCCSMA